MSDAHGEADARARLAERVHGRPQDGSVEAVARAALEQTRQNLKRLREERDNLHATIKGLVAEQETLQRVVAVFDRVKAAENAAPAPGSQEPTLPLDAACPHDPDGQHYVGCGCDADTDWSDPTEPEEGQEP